MHVVFMPDGQGSARRGNKRHIVPAIHSLKRLYLMAAPAVVLMLGIAIFTSAPARAGCEDAFFSSGIAWTGSSVVLVATPMGNSGGDLSYFWQQTGTTAWHRELVASTGGCPASWENTVVPQSPTGYRSNAIAWTGDSVVIAAVDVRNGGLYYWWQAKGSTVWHQQLVAAGPPECCSFYSVLNGKVTPLVVGYSMPSIAWTGSAVVIAASDKHGLHYWFQQKKNTTWYEELVAPFSVVAPLQPAIAWTGSSVVIASSCNGNESDGMCYYVQPAGSATWGRQVVDTGYSLFPSIAWTGSAVVIAANVGVTGSDNAIATWTQAAGTTAWRKEQVGAVSQYGGPAVGAAGNSVVVAAIDENIKLQVFDFWWKDQTSSGTWALQHPPGSAQYSGWMDPGGITWTGKSIVMASTDACGDLDYWWQQFATPTWHKQRVVTSGNWPPSTCG
jgi:hypothetical protein